MKQLKIGKKLSILVMSLLLCLGVVAGASLFLMSRISDAGNEISKKWLASVVVAEEINTLTQDYRMNEQGYILSATSTMRQRYKDQIEETQKLIEKGISAYSAMVKSDKDRKLIEDAKQKLDQYMQLSQEMTSYTDQNQIDQAALLLNGQSKTAFDDIAYSCTQLVDLSKQGAKQAGAEADRLYRVSVRLLLCLFAAGLVCSIVLAVYIVRMILKPIRQLHTATEAIGTGCLDIKTDYTSKDELGQIAVAFRDMSAKLKTIIQDIKYLLGEMADGNFMLQTTCENGYVGEFAEILLAMRRLNQNLSMTLSQIDTVSDQVASGAEQVSDGAQALSQGATEQASAIEELSASVTEVSAQVKQNAENAKSASGSAEMAGRELSECNGKMKNMLCAMEEITERSSEISKIIKVIEDIAFQTNILALNAAVEAARAGAAGKGFAVVADEVRNLASKSAAAASSTTKLIEETLTAVQNGSGLAQSTATLMETSAKATQRAVSLIDAIATASGQQAQAISQVDIGVEQIASVVQTNSATAQESAAASEELSGQAQTLKNLISHFRLRREAADESETPAAKLEEIEQESGAADGFGTMDKYAEG